MQYVVWVGVVVKVENVVRLGVVLEIKHAVMGLMAPVVVLILRVFVVGHIVVIQVLLVVMEDAVGRKLHNVAALIVVLLLMFVVVVGVVLPGQLVVVLNAALA